MSDDLRHGVRLQTRFETLYCADRQEGQAILANVSHSGALLECSARPALGSRVMLYVCLPDGEKPVELRGQVVRHTPRGFAIYYDKPNPDVVRFVDDESAITSMLSENEAGSPTASDDDVLDLTDEWSLTEEEVEMAEQTVVASPDESVLDDDILVHVEPPVAATPAPTPAAAPGGAPMLLSELDLGPYSISELEALAQRIPAVIAAKRTEAKQRVRQKLAKMAEQEGFSLEELLQE